MFFEAVIFQSCRLTLIALWSLENCCQHLQQALSGQVERMLEGVYARVLFFSIAFVFLSSFTVMPCSKRTSIVKKIALKSESKKVVRFDVNEAVDISKKAVGAMNVNQIDLTRRLDSLEMETITKIDHYLCHDKSTINVKLEKVGLFAPDLVRITAFRDFLSNVIDKSLDVIHDAIITSTCVLPPGWPQYMLIGLHFLFLHHFFHHFVRPPHVFCLQHSSRPYLQQKEEDLTVSYGL